MAFAHCEQQLGAAWVYAPGRWRTSDGCVPFPVVWAYFGTLRMGHAVASMDTARAIGLAFGGDGGQRAWATVLDEAFPDDRAVGDAEGLSRGG